MLRFYYRKPKVISASKFHDIVTYVRFKKIHCILKKIERYLNPIGYCSHLVAKLKHFSTENSQKSDYKIQTCQFVLLNYWQSP